ncbi:MAG: M23 family metallopeptidase [Polyangiaceae bacterium]|nr:M23 family metallopeptidase [Polyangiaceae bacterium]
MRFFAGILAATATLPACTTPPNPAPGVPPAAEDEPRPALARPTPAPPAPTAARPRVAPPAPPELPRPLRYVLPVDHGVRADSGGRGGFLAPRSHGRHNGLDLLAPIGTPVLAPCSGPARSGNNSSFGKWVQVVCELPGEVVRSPAYLSFFFSHLAKIDIDAAQSVDAGSRIGAVGKTGNASSNKIAPHLHLEVVVHDTRDRALAESHSGRDQSDTQAADRLMSALESRCFEPTGLAKKEGSARRARRTDPFLLLSCLGSGKPGLSTPPRALRSASEAWSEHYQARTFDVDQAR